MKAASKDEGPWASPKTMSPKRRTGVALGAGQSGGA